MRTEEEKKAFALECMRIEEEDGDVLGYIRDNWPSYTPRPTWYKLQSMYLNRNQKQFTEGKPKGGESVTRMMELAYGAIEASTRGENVYDYLERQGSKNPSAYWYQIKATVKLKDQELYEKLAALPRVRKKKPKEQLDSGKPEIKIHNGKEFERMLPSPTCCQQAKQRGPIKWDDNEAMTDGPEEISMRKLSIKEEPIKELKIRTLHGEMGTYEKLADDRMLFTGSPRPFADCGYTVAEWFVLIEELQLAIKQLGLK